MHGKIPTKRLYISWLEIPFLSKTNISLANLIIVYDLTNNTKEKEMYHANLPTLTKYVWSSKHYLHLNTNYLECERSKTQLHTIKVIILWPHKIHLTFNFGKNSNEHSRWIKSTRIKVLTSLSIKGYWYQSYWHKSLTQSPEAADPDIV